jgi:hypothetical protein
MNPPSRIRPSSLKPVAAAVLLAMAQQVVAGGGTQGGYQPPEDELALYWDWHNQVASDWFHPYNWLPFHNEAPGADKIAVLTGGYPVLDANATVLAYYQWSADGPSILSGAGTLNTGALSWGSGTQSGSGGMVVAGDASLGFADGYATLELKEGRFLTLNGDTTFQATWLGLGNGSRVYNNGSFTSAGDRRSNGTVQDNNLLSSGTGNVFQNNGSFIQDAAGHTTTVAPVFNNAGLVQVRSGNLRLVGGGAHHGSFAVLSGQSLEFTGNHQLNSGSLVNDGLIRFNTGSHDLNALVTYSGAGTLQVAGGTVNLGVSVGMDVATLRISGGKLNASQSLGSTLRTGRLELVDSGVLAGTATIQAGELDWRNGTLQGPGYTRVLGQAQLGDGNVYGSLYLEGGRALELRGDTTFQAAFLGLNNASAIHNTGHFTSLGGRRGGGVYDNTLVNFSGNSVFNNMGSFTQDAQGRTTTVQTVFNNDGQVWVKSGTMKLAGGGGHRGSFQVQAGQTLEFGGGSHGFTGASLDNAGTVRVSGGSVALGRGVAYSGQGGLHVLNGTLVLDQAALLNPLWFTLGAGTAQVDSSLHTQALSQVAGTLKGAGEVKADGLHWEGGAMAGAGTTRVTGQATLGNGSSYGNLILDGRRLVLEGASTLQAFQVSMSNGAVLENAGLLTSRGDVRGASVYDNHLVQQSLGAASLFRNTGTFVQDAGGHTTRIGMAFENQGQVRVESGRLVFDGGFSMLGDGSGLELAITGASNDSLDANALAVLDGTLTLRFDGYAASAGDVIKVFDYGSYSGSFDHLVAQGLGPGLALTGLYNDHDFSVQISAVPELDRWALMLAGLGLVGLASRRYRQEAGHLKA